MKFQLMQGGRICKSFKADCVVRSISFVLNQSYDSTFTALMNLGMEMGAYPSHDKVWIRYLEESGFVKNKPPRDSAGKLIKLRDWEAPKLRAVARNSRHLTAVVDGYCVDEWDCTYRPVNSYWAKP